MCNQVKQRQSKREAKRRDGGILHVHKISLNGFCRLLVLCNGTVYVCLLPLSDFLSLSHTHTFARCMFLFLFTCLSFVHFSFFFLLTCLRAYVWMHMGVSVFIKCNQYVFSSQTQPHTNGHEHTYTQTHTQVTCTFTFELCVCNTFRCTKLMCELLGSFFCYRCWSIGVFSAFPRLRLCCAWASVNCLHRICTHVCT